MRHLPIPDIAEQPIQKGSLRATPVAQPNSNAVAGVKAMKFGPFRSCFQVKRQQSKTARLRYALGSEQIETSNVLAGYITVGTKVNDIDPVIRFLAQRIRQSLQQFPLRQASCRDRPRPLPENGLHLASRTSGRRRIQPCCAENLSVSKVSIRHRMRWVNGGFTHLFVCRKACQMSSNSGGITLAAGVPCLRSVSSASIRSNRFGLRLYARTRSSRTTVVFHDGSAPFAALPPRGPRREYPFQAPSDRRTAGAPDIGGTALSY